MVGVITAPSILFAFNEVGQLYNKQLHSTDQGASFMQKLSYDYNERGWLRHSASSASLFNQELNMVIKPIDKKKLEDPKIAKQL